MSGWIIFTICFTTLLVGTWAALTVYEFHRAGRKMREAEAARARPGRAVLSDASREGEGVLSELVMHPGSHRT